MLQKNYKKFLYKPDVKELNIESDLRSLELLLPEDDSSKDYFPPEKSMKVFQMKSLIVIWKVS